MKALKNIVLLILISNGVSAQTIFQGIAFPVANGGIYGSFRPRLTLDRSGDPVVLWGSNIGGYKGFTATWNGSGFNLPFRIHPTSIIANNVESPQITSYGDTVHVVYSLSPAMSQKVRIRSSIDGGNTWGEPVAVDSLNTQNEIATFPSVTTDSNGHPIVVFMRQNMDYSNPRYVIRRSENLGATFLPIVDATGQAPGNEACDCCFSSIYMPTVNEVIIPFRRNANNTRDMWASRSTDGGLSFAHAIDLDSTDWFIPACPSSGPVALFFGDSILTAFMSEGGDGFPRIYLSLAQRDSSVAFWNDTLAIAGGTSIAQNHPTLAGIGDTLGIAFEHNTGTDNDIYFAWSTTGISGLLACQPIPVGAGSANQRTPDLKFKNGLFHLVYADNATGNVIYKQLAFSPLVSMEHQQSKSLNVYPNPSHLHFRVQWSEVAPFNSELTLTNSLGQVVRRLDVSGMEGITLEQGGLSGGIYFLQLRGSNRLNGCVRVVLQ